MKGEIRLGKITSIDYAKGMARVVYHEKRSAVAGQWRHPIAVEGLAKGIHNLHVDLVGRRFSKRVVIQ